MIRATQKAYRTRTVRHTILGGMVGVIFVALTGCATGPLPSNAPPAKTVVRIAVMDQSEGTDAWFRTHFIEPYEITHPKVTVEWTAFSQDTFEENAGENVPDVLILDTTQLQTWIKNQALQPLDAFIAKGAFAADKIVPIVDAGIRSFAPDGQLYALSPLFRAYALYYNRALFERAGIPYPTDKMTWEAVFALAAQFRTTKGGAYGFSFSPYLDNKLFWDVPTYTKAIGLRYYDEQARKMTVNTPAWAEVWTRLITLHRAKTIPGRIATPKSRASMPPPSEEHAFLSEKIPMVIEDSLFIADIQQYNEAREKEDKPPLAWDVVTFPTHPQFPDVGGSVEMVGLFSIPVGASNPQGAWEFISFVHGDAWAKQKAKSQPWISSHRNYATPKAGMTTNMQAFYQLKPSFRVDYSPLITQYPRLTAIERIGERKLEEAVKGKKTVSRALQEWANEGDGVLKQIHKNATKTTPPR